MKSGGHYEHSGKFSPALLLLGAGVALAVALPLAWLYAQGIARVSFVVFNVLLTAAFGLALAALNLRVMRAARVRSGRAFLAAALVVTGAALYFHWAVWVGLVSGGPSAGGGAGALAAVLRPAALWSEVLAINEAGAWSILDASFSGLPLWGVWAAEAGIVLWLGAVQPRHAFLDVPFCESCGTWCRKERNIARITGARPARVVEALEARDLPALASFPSVPPDETEGAWFEFDCERCPVCGVTCTLDVVLVSAAVGGKGEKGRSVETIVENVLLTAGELAAVRALGEADATADAGPGARAP